MKIAVTGGTGHIALNVIVAALKRGWSVRATYRDATLLEHPVLRGLPVEWVRADLLDPASLKKAFADRDAVAHVAAPNHVAVRDIVAELERPIVLGTQNVLRAAQGQGVRRVVMTSSCSAVGTRSSAARPLTEDRWNWGLRFPMLRAKVTAEDWAWKNAASLDLQFFSVCLPAVLGPGFLRWSPRTEFLKSALRGFLPPTPDIGFHWLDARDAGEGHILCLEKDNLAPSRFILAGDYVDARKNLLAWREVDHRIKGLPWALPDGMVMLLSRLDEGRARLLGGAAELPVALAQDLLEFDQHVDSSRARSILGWTSRPLTDTFCDSLTWAKALRTNQWDNTASLLEGTGKGSAVCRAGETSAT